MADCYAFPGLVFYLHVGDFEMLQHFASHDVCSKNVMSLVYSTDILPRKRVSFKKFVAKKESDDELHESAGLSTGRQQANHRKPLARPVYTDNDCRRHYEEYVAVHKRQAQILASEVDFDVLREVIPKFTRLRELRVFTLDRNFKPGRDPFDTLFVQAQDDLESKACRHIASLLNPLIGLGPTIHSLDLEEVSRLLLGQLQDPTKFNHVVDICRNLTTFNIQIDTVTFESNEVGIFVPECKAILRKGEFRRLIRAMSHLESLTVVFSYMDEQNGPWPAGLRDLVSESTQLPFLKHVNFDILEASRIWSTSSFFTAAH